jgi:hypothetical protein
MNKRTRNKTIVLFALFAFAAVSAGAVEIAENGDGTYHVGVTERVLRFLEANGVDIRLIGHDVSDHELGNQIAGLSKVLVDEDDAEWTFGDELNAIINGELMAAYAAGYQPVSMVIGPLKWTLATE